MKRHIPGLHQQALNSDDNLEGLLLVRVERAFRLYYPLRSTLHVELKRPRVIDVVPVDFLRDELPERKGRPTQKFSGQLTFSLKDDVTIRRPSRAILVIDSYEIAVISDGKNRFKAQ